MEVDGEGDATAAGSASATASADAEVTPVSRSKRRRVDAKGLPTDGGSVLGKRKKASEELKDAVMFSAEPELVDTSEPRTQELHPGVVMERGQMVDIKVTDRSGDLVWTTGVICSIDNLVHTAVLHVPHHGVGRMTLNLAEDLDKIAPKGRYTEPSK